MTERPWTPGPWHLAHEDCPNDAGCMVVAHARTGSCAEWSVHAPNAIWTHDDGNAELIALAPEMAEAIIAFELDDACVRDGCICVTHANCRGCDALAEIARLREALQRIGGDDA